MGAVPVMTAHRAVIAGTDTLDHGQ